MSLDDEMKGKEQRFSFQNLGMNNPRFMIQEVRAGRFYSTCTRVSFL